MAEDAAKMSITKSTEESQPESQMEKAPEAPVTKPVEDASDALPDSSSPVPINLVLRLR